VYVYLFECEQQVKMKIPGADECNFKGAYSTGLLHPHSNSMSARVNSCTEDILGYVVLCQNSIWNIMHHRPWSFECICIYILQFQSVRVIRHTIIIMSIPREPATRARRPARHCLNRKFDPVIVRLCVYITVFTSVCMHVCQSQHHHKCAHVCECAHVCVTCVHECVRWEESTGMTGWF